MADYFDQMDKFLAPNEENRFINPNSENTHLQQPIIPISELGTTFTEKGSGQQTVLQSMISSIRRGTGSLQLAMQADHNAAMFGGVSSISKAQRQAIKEAIQSSGVKWHGLEMPTSSMSDVSGYNPQQKQFSEQKRQSHIQKIKDAIQFNAELGFGGGVDVWSQEFHRDIYSAEFNKQDKEKYGTQMIDFEGFDENKDANKMLVDRRTGQIFQINTGQLGGNGPTISVPIYETAKENGIGPDGVPYKPGDYLDSMGNKLDANANSQKFIEERVPVWDATNGKIMTKQMTWQEFKKYTQERNEKEKANLTPEEWAVRMQLETQYGQQKAQIDYHTQRYERELEEIKDLAKAKKEFEEFEKGKSEQELLAQNLLVPVGPVSQGGQFLKPKYKKKSEIIDESIRQLKRSLSYSQDSASHSETQAINTWESIQNLQRIEEFGKKKTSDSYAELGIYALEESKKHGTAEPIHVGPELGWPTAYGGHPKEFIEIIQNARKEMVEKMKKDPQYKSMYTENEMKKLAEQHIAGEMDTSHMSMWFNHFPKQHPRESEEDRLKRFNKWYLQQMEDLAKAKVIGGLQVVDSLTGDHRHLPVGQGVFPIVEAVKILKKHGYKGSIVSEGHEDEPSEPGSTQFSLWTELGGSIGSHYHFGSTKGGNPFGNIYSGLGGAAGYRIPPGYSFGAYSPSEEFKPWSGVPDF
ncbi:MAG: TIM barrel protein [Candidatus Woesearchaeota archaeon]